LDVRRNPAQATGDKPVADEGARRPNAPWYVKAFVVFHLIAITIWALPNPPANVQSGEQKPIYSDYLLFWNWKWLKPLTPVQVYNSTTGFWQYWDMFAPNPASTDIYCDAEVVFKDGTKKHYQYPRMYLLGIGQKYVNERYRKYFERVNQEQYSYLWPLFAQRIAYLNDNRQNPPVTVRLKRYWRPVAGPGMVQQPDYNSYLFYEHAVDRRQLARMREGKT